MIRTSRSKALADLFRSGKSSRIDAKIQKRLLVRLDRLDAGTVVDDLNLPGYNFHGLRGFDPKRYTIHVNGPWCITFEFENGDAYRVDFEQYH